MNKMDCLLSFQSDISHQELPERFTFPFYYDPHPLCEIAASELQSYLLNQTDFRHNFGLDERKKGMVIGKMFGVLVVKSKAGELGYLAAFSGKLADQNHHKRFVPPVYDMLGENSYFNQKIVILNDLNHRIKVLEANPDFLEAKAALVKVKVMAEQAIDECKQAIKANKNARKKQRQQAQTTLSQVEFEQLKETLSKQSIKEQYFLKDLVKQHKGKISKAEVTLQQHQKVIDDLKQQRKQKSADLQQWLFEQYRFLNQSGEWKHLKQIFEEQPPAGAGECAAPKLLQYAFAHQLEPIAMAEFWWGASPKSAIRKHKQFYPACRGKCQPILRHMLKGIETDPNPMLQNTAEEKEIDILFEDESLLVIHKPYEMLSVPGKHVKDSVQTRLKKRYADATGPLVVHRLDMSTSGLMLVAKNKIVHQNLQRQFIKKQIQKRYVALLEGTVTEQEGTIDLPLRVDLDDRPRQLVCYEHGKSARTHWKVIDRMADRTLIHFFPVTGRTHQLRVHAAHHLGLNAPIVGDDLYGNKADRLHLHAEWIAFTHPITKAQVAFEWKAEFVPIR